MMMRQSKRMKFAKFYDDVTGKLLPGHLFRAARQDEVKFLNTFPVYKKAPEANAEGKGTCLGSVEVGSVHWADVHG